MSQELRADTAQDNPPDSTPEAMPGMASQPTRTVRRDGVEYTLIGTAHVSRASAEAVSELSASGDFDAIAVELCQARYDPGLRPSNNSSPTLHDCRRWL